MAIVKGRYVPRERKQKALRRQRESRQQEQAQEQSPHDPTTNGVSDADLDPLSQNSLAAHRLAIRETVPSHGPRPSRKKQKRLDKYIENKLKKDEKAALLRRLEEGKVDTSLFVSSKTLGRGKESQRERLSRALKERRAGVNVAESEGVLFRTVDQAEDEEDSEEESAAESEEEDRASIAKGEPTVSKPTALFGSGLKRPLDVGEDGRPVIQSRKRVKRHQVNYTPLQAQAQADEESEWEGFGSESDGGVNVPQVSEDSEEEAMNSSGTSVTDSEESAEDDTDGNENEQDYKSRSSAFKTWALKQRNEAVGFTPSLQIQSSTQNGIISQKADFHPRPLEFDPLPPELQMPTANTLDHNRKAFAVPVRRAPTIQEARLALPVVAEEQKIMETIHNHDVVVVCGATGSGKTTQVPQFLFEAGYGSKDGPTPGMIAVTQPRRVAAVSMAKRVAEEMGDAGDRVGYQIRFDSSVSRATAIKFMTDGVLVREIGQDISLVKYSIIIVDEAHERSVNTDLLLGFLSRTVGLRAQMAKDDPQIPPLKLVIMSATLRISDFLNNDRLFRNGPPPMVEAEGRQYPVTVHFSRRTQRDYVDEMYHKVSRGHKRLPPGAMLVFLTGQSEITTLSKRLKTAFAATDMDVSHNHKLQTSAAEMSTEADDFDLGNSLHDLDNDGSDDDEDDPGFRGVDNDEEKEFDIGEQPGGTATSKVHILPLYSQLPTNQQLRVFQPPPPGSRLIVLATNVAETSLTIPGIRYVFDCGRSKEKHYNSTTGVQNFAIGWISKASAGQRAGRAGRTGPGHCYRLYSSAVYERDFAEHMEPEILRTPIEAVALQLKSMEIRHVARFPFPTPPDTDSLTQAEKLLQYLGAIDINGRITSLGRELSAYPLNPRFARMFVLSQRHGLTECAAALVAALAVPELFITQSQLTHDEATAEDFEGVNDQSSLQKSYNKAMATLSRSSAISDAMKMFTAVCAYDLEKDHAAFCDRFFLHPKALHEASQLRHQLYGVARANTRDTILPTYNPRIEPPTSEQHALLQQIVAMGFIDQVAIRADLGPDPPDLPRKPTRSIDVPYTTLFPSHTHRTPAADATDSERYVFIHPSSVLAHYSHKKLPQYLVYSHLQASTPRTAIESVPHKVRMHPLGPVSGAQLAAFADGTPLLEYGKPLSMPTVLPTDAQGRERRQCTVVPSLVGDRARAPWPLPAKRVVQRRELGKGWVLEEELE